jgi:hypothetical protein
MDREMTFKMMYQAALDALIIGYLGRHTMADLKEAVAVDEETGADTVLDDICDIALRIAQKAAITLDAEIVTEGAPKYA